MLRQAVNSFNVTASAPPADSLVVELLHFLLYLQGQLPGGGQHKHIGAVPLLPGTVNTQTWVTHYTETP